MVVARLDLPPAREITGPVRADLSRFVTAGSNAIEVRRTGQHAAAQAQVSATYYVPWADAPKAPGTVSDLNLRVAFDRTSARIGDTVTCSVSAKRTGCSYYGMMIAEIGLPPGVDVDRRSLDNAGVDRYDILPDKLVVYVWPHYDGANFTFRFRPRIAMSAKNAGSMLYDYYNPEARVDVAPVRFTIAK